MFCNESPERLIASLLKGATAATVALLLGGCANQAPLLSSDHHGDDARRGTMGAAASAQAKGMRITSRDILSEWSTYGIDPWPQKQRRSTTASLSRDSLDQPDYTVTIEQIMANAVCRSCEEKPYHHMVVKASNRHGVPTSLIHAVIQKESGYNPRATSNKRARGLMQVTPGTGKFMGVSNSQHLYDPQTNINAGVAYLKYLMANHDTVDEVLAAYNSGPGNVRKYKGVPPFGETKRYVRDVKKLYVTTSKE